VSDRPGAPVKNLRLTNILIRSRSSKSLVQIGVVSHSSLPFDAVPLCFCLPEHQKRLATFAIVLGSLYMGAFVIFVFGIAAAATVCPSLKNGRLLRSLRSQKRLALIRIFSFLSVVVAVIVVASGLIRTIVHFMLKVCTWCYYLFLG
jgi:hypothetical protein